MQVIVDILMTFSLFLFVIFFFLVIDLVTTVQANWDYLKSRGYNHMP